MEDYRSRHQGVIPAASRFQAVPPDHGFSTRPMATSMTAPMTMTTGPMTAPMTMTTGPSTMLPGGLEWVPRPPSTLLPHGPPVPMPRPCPVPRSWVTPPSQMPGLVPLRPVPEPENPPSWMRQPTSMPGLVHMGNRPVPEPQPHQTETSPGAACKAVPPWTRPSPPAAAPSQSPSLRPLKDFGFVEDTFCPFLMFYFISSYLDLLQRLWPLATSP